MHFNDEWITSAPKPYCLWSHLGCEMRPAGLLCKLPSQLQGYDCLAVLSVYWLLLGSRKADAHNVLLCVKKANTACHKWLQKFQDNSKRRMLCPHIPTSTTSLCLLCSASLPICHISTVPLSCAPSFLSSVSFSLWQFVVQGRSHQNQYEARVSGMPPQVQSAPSGILLNIFRNCI